MTTSADLHVHTSYSDSSSSPREVVRAAVKAGLAAIAITDHDTIDGIIPTREAAQAQDLEVIAGVELSTEIHNKDIHILGYFFDPLNSWLTEKLREFQDSRTERIKQMIVKLQSQGVNNIEFEEVDPLNDCCSLGRPHLASLLIKKGWAANNRAVFDKFLGEGCPAYVPKFKQTPSEAVALIRQAGGVAVMAHPMVTSRDELIPELVEAGLGGLEVYYPNCNAQVTQYYESLAQKHGLVMTGGSDAHGENKDSTFIGKCRIDYQQVERLRSKAKTQ